MKKILLFIGIIITAVSCGAPTQVQTNGTANEVNNFKLGDGSVTWSKVYQFTASEFDAVKSWFDSNFKITKDTEKTIIGETNSDSLPIEEVGYKRMGVVMLLTHPCVVYFTTDFKEDRYRVTVNRIIWTPQLVTARNGIGTMSLNEIAVQKNGFKPIFYNTTSVQLDKMLDYMFTARLNQSSSNDNW